jgi:hypothetical protein
LTTTLLWTLFYVLIALVAAAIVVRAIAGLRHRNAPRGPYGRQPRE